MDEQQAEAAYWQIDNEVVVQGNLFNSAVPTIEVLLAGVCSVASLFAKRAVVELIQQISCGESALVEIEANNPNLGEQVRMHAREALWLMYGWLADEDEDVRECSLLTLASVERARGRLRLALRGVAAHDPSEKVRNTARRALENMDEV
jgi:hypothetical protein